MAIVTVTGPALEPIALSDLKNDLKVDSDLTEDDFLISGLLTAARRWVEQVLRRALVTQTLELWLDGWPSTGTLEIPRPPLQSVTSVKYYDEEDQEATFSADNYFVDTKSSPGRVVLNADAEWPSTVLRPANGVVVRFVCGYGDEEGDIPEHLVQAIRLLVSHWYENREAVAATGAVPKEVPFGVEALLWVDRTW